MTRPQRRRSIVAAYANAGLWGVGSGLASTTLITYLARAHGASSVGISWILAAPSLVGLLRLATPAWLDRAASRRRFCVTLFLASAAVLALLPILSAPGVLPTTNRAVLALAAAWTGYQLLEFLAVVALWSWLGDLAPPPIRGRFLGRREAWLNAGILAGTLTAIGITLLVDVIAPPFNTGDLQRRAYAACGLTGAGVLAIAALSLLKITDLPHAPRRSARRAIRLRHLLAPLVDPRYRRFMAFGLWFSASNGIVQAAQSIFPMAALDLSFAKKRTLDGALRAGKALLLPSIGRAIDRRGAVPVLAASQAIISLAPLFFLFATPAAVWWIVGAYLCWLAYAGHDVALPNLMLGLSPPGETPAYAAAWFAWTQLAFALSTLAGGFLFDWLSQNFAPHTIGGRPMNHYVLLFVGSWILKSLGILFAARIRERQAAAA